MTHNSGAYKRLPHLPATPGVYRFYDAKDALLYVGKAKNLRARVRSYFRTHASLAEDKRVMVKRVVDIQWTIVDNETEALLLETTLIKKHRPPFNIVMRDDKNFVYIKITRQTFPRVITTRRVHADHAAYFGPFTSAIAVRNVMRTIQTVFATRNKRRHIPDTHVPEDMRCILHEPGACSGLCKGLVQKSDYAETIAKIIDFLKGKYDALEKEMTTSMRAAAARQQFEKAARLRDELTALQRISTQQKMIDPRGGNEDVLALARDDTQAAINLFRIRAGKLVAADQVLLTHTAHQPDADVVSAFAQQYYAAAVDTPDALITAQSVDLPSSLHNLLARHLPKNKKFHVRTAQRGKKKKLLDLGKRNAEQFLATQKASFEKLTSTQALTDFIKAVAPRTATPPNGFRVEVYDISNTQGTNAVGSMVVFIDGEKRKADYRTFTISLSGKPDDFAMMAEMLTRRQAHADWPRPDVVILDGGKGQLSAVLRVLNAGKARLAPTQSVLALAKREEILYQQNPDGTTREIRLPKNVPALFLVQRMRDEAHRFAITLHKKKRGRNTLHSWLDDVEGIGQVTRKKLLRSFGSADAIRAASRQELERVVGSAKARILAQE